MMPAVMRLVSATALAAFVLLASPGGRGQDAAAVPVESPRALEPFVASYEAHYRGKPAGNATMRVVHERRHWRIDLDIAAHRGLAGVLGLNLEQSTVFESNADVYRPLSQSTVRKGLFMGRKAVGTYDWSARSARWQGDVKKKHRDPVALRDGDMSALLINLAIIRDARPGAVLRYRFVDAGRARDHVYQTSATPETIAVGELSYQTLRVARVNSNDETVLWVAEGVPTPVRLLQREDGKDAIDLRLIEYRGME